MSGASEANIKRAPVVVLGAGAWGTALAVHSARQQPTLIYTRDAMHAQAMQTARRNDKYLPAADPRLGFPESLSVTADLSFAVRQARGGLLVLGTAMAGLRSTVKAVASLLVQERLQEGLEARLSPQHVIWLCKGIEASSELLASQVLAQEFSARGLIEGRDVMSAALSGPSFALEVAQGLPSSLALATSNPALRALCIHTLHHSAMRIYAVDDLVGVELAGALKNVIALAAGAADGLNLGLNARAALITRGLSEMSRLGLAMGANPQTFMGLAGVGDLLLTCTGDLSRNRKVGKRLAEGLKLDQVLAELGHVSEGVACARAAQRLAKQHGVELPIVDAVCRVLFEDQAPKDMVKRLLAREPRRE